MKAEQERDLKMLCFCLSWQKLEWGRLNLLSKCLWETSGQTNKWKNLYFFLIVELKANSKQAEGWQVESIEDGKHRTEHRLWVGRWLIYHTCSLRAPFLTANRRGLIRHVNHRHRLNNVQFTSPRTEKAALKKLFIFSSTSFILFYAIHIVMISTSDLFASLNVAVPLTRKATDPV